MTEIFSAFLCFHFNLFHQIRYTYSVRRVLYCTFLRALWLNIPGLIFIVTLCCLDGMVIFAVYADCDLKESKKVTSNDQVHACQSTFKNNDVQFRNNATQWRCLTLFQKTFTF